jgi:hypothetical protein
MPGTPSYRPRHPDFPGIVLCDVVNPSSGKTYREENLEKAHTIPIGALVEVHGDEDNPSNGSRLFVAWHGRDCDGTPLYWLSPTKDDADRPDAKSRWIGGFAGESLRIIQ